MHTLKSFSHSQTPITILRYLLSENCLFYNSFLFENDLFYSHLLSENCLFFSYLLSENYLFYSCLLCENRLFYSSLNVLSDTLKRVLFLTHAYIHTNEQMIQQKSDVRYQLRRRKQIIIFKLISGMKMMA